MILTKKNSLTDLTFNSKYDAKVYAKKLRKTKIYSSVQVKKRQSTDKNWRGKYRTKIIWYVLDVYKK